MEEIINEIIKDLGSDKPIKGILLKSQIVASELGNEDFSTWINYEQNGYPDAKNIPNYRIIGAIVKVDVFVPYQGYVNNQTLPMGIFDDEVINDCMGHVRIIQSLSEIENLCAGNEGGTLSQPLPAMAYVEVNKYIRGEAQRVRQEFPSTALLRIVDIFKSKLLDFFLKLNIKIKGGIDFSQISHKENQQIIGNIMNNTYNINAAIANTGSGKVCANDINASNFQISPTIDERTQMNDLIAKIEEVLTICKNSDATEALDAIKEEVSKESWSKKTLRMALNALNGIATGVLANQISPLVAQGLSLLAP